MIKSKGLFMTGIGTDIGKTFVSTLMLKAISTLHYWKPIQAGLQVTDTNFLKKYIDNSNRIYPELFKLKHAQSAHSAAQKENININIKQIEKKFLQLSTHHKNNILIEGVGGLLSPINDKLQNIHLIKKLNLDVIVVSKNYLGSLNHSLMLAQVLHYHQIKPLGWVFIDYNNRYKKEIVKWSKIPELFSFNNLTEKDLIKNSTLLKGIKNKFSKTIDTQ